MLFSVIWDGVFALSFDYVVMEFADFCDFLFEVFVV